jgi:two-component sensor histidine kinase
LTWNVLPERGGEERRLVVRWTESGGPPVTSPERRGFGLRLLERGLAQQLEAEVELGFEPGGLRAVLGMPIRVAQSQAGC